MFTHYRTRALVLKKGNLGESDQIVYVFTEDFGKLVLMARAARKIKSKLRGGLKLFSLSEIEFIQGKRQKTLTDSEIKESFSGIGKDLRKLALAFRMAEVVNSLVGGEEKDRKIWSLLKESFRLLDKKQIEKKEGSFEKGSWKLVYYYFFWNLADFLGFRPQLKKCLFCQGSLKGGPVCFNSEEGGVICSKCSAKMKKGQKISEDSVKILRVVLEKDWKKLSRLKLSSDHFQEMRKIAENYHKFLLGLQEK